MRFRCPVLQIERMNKIILLVLNDADAAQIPAAVEKLRKIKPEGVWVIHNPHLGVTDEKLLAGFDKEIEGLNQAMRDAVKREDFEAANAYKLKRESREVDRQLAIREGWKSVPKEKLQVAYDRLLKGLDASVAQNILVTTLRDSCDPKDIFSVLHGLRGEWPVALSHGSYVVAWPASLPDLLTGSGETKIDSNQIESCATQKQRRGVQMKRAVNAWNELVTKAKALGVYRFGMKKPELESAIASVQQSTAASVAAAA